MRISKRAYCAALVPLAIALSSDAALATTCGRPADATTVPPPIGVRAPRNVQPRVTLPAGWRAQSFCLPWMDQQRCVHGRFDITLRAVGAGEALVPVTLRESTSGEIATVVIVPRSHLAANQRFEILYVDQSDQSEKEAPRLLATFATSDRIDDKPPIWSGVTSHSRIGAWPQSSPPPPPKKVKPRVVVLDDDPCTGPGITFIGAAAATDDDSRREDLHYAIWMAEPEAAIDYAAPPLAYEAGTLEWQRPSSLALVIRFGGRLPPSDFAFPAGKRAMKVGLRAIDLAGNASAPSEQLVQSQ